MHRRDEEHYVRWHDRYQIDKPVKAGHVCHRSLPPFFIGCRPDPQDIFDRKTRSKEELEHLKEILVLLVDIDPRLDDKQHDAAYDKKNDDEGGGAMLSVCDVRVVEMLRNDLFEGRGLRGHLIGSRL